VTLRRKPAILPAMAEQPPRIISRKRALVCLGMNALGFPGLGTIMAGRAIGYVQAALMCLGFFLFVGFMMLYLTSSVGSLNRFMLTGVTEDPTIHYEPWLWVLWLGLALSFLAWTWSIISSLVILRQTPPEPPPQIQ
jgi:hypothetical protein